MAKKTKALAKRTTKVTKKPKPRPVIVKAPEPPRHVEVLTDDPDIGDFGLVEIKLTEKEEAVLSEPAPAVEVQIKPTGQIYLSHPTYTRWFNRAFGRMGWKLSPKAKPKFDQRTIVVPYILYIHGKPAAFAYGEQEYFGGDGGNREQTYGDAIEATVASALRRCAKRLGVGLELWDKVWADTWVHTFAQRVYVEGKNGQRSARWRRKDAPPLPYEVGAKRDEEPRSRASASSAPPRQATAERPALPARQDDRLVSEGQVRRLVAIIKHSGREEADVRVWLKTRFNIDHADKIRRSDYDAICSAIESADILQ